MKRVGAFVILTRPHFLLGGLALFALGASTGGVISWPRYLIAQAMVTAAQVTAHYVNEFFDMDADRLVEHRTLFSGGSGVLPKGDLGRGVALWAGIATSAAAVAAALAVARWSLAAAVLGLLALAVSWMYSAVPVRLLDTGWGEAATSIVVTVIVPFIGAWALGGSITAFLGWAVAALLPIHMAMMLAFELPDLTTDAAAGKTVLAVRIGEPATRRLMGTLFAVSIVAFFGGAWFSKEVASFATAGTVALLPISATLLSARARRYPLLTSSAVLSLAGPALALLLTAPATPGS